MTTFTPTSIAMEPVDRPDYLAGAVLQSLSRPAGRRKAWGMVKTLVLGTISFGIAPLIVWPRNFRQEATVEQQQLWHLGEWLRLRTGRPAAAALRDSTAKMGFRPVLWVLALVVAGVMVMNLQQALQRSLPHDLMAVTYGYHRGRWFIEDGPRSVARQLFDMWTGALSLAYFFCWLQVQLHAADVRRYVRRFNAIAAEEGLSPISPPVLGIGIYPKWLAGGIIMVLLNAVWGIPMMLAGAVHQMYANYTSPATRGQLAYRVRAMLMSQRPQMNVPMPMRLRGACENEKCMAALPKDAKYCPRCGRRAAEEGFMRN